MTISHALTHSIFALPIALTGICLALSAQADEVVSVTMESGRRFTAQIDRRTDDQHLWLRFGDRSAKLLRPIRWEQILSAEHEEHVVSVEELRELAMSLDRDVAAPSSAAESAHQGAGHSGALTAVPSQEAVAKWFAELRAEADEAQAPSTMADVARWAVADSRRLQSVQFDAWLANWDGDVEADGLVLTIFPLDDRGGIIAVDGTISVELFASVRTKFHEVPHDRGQSVREIARFTASLTAEEVGVAGAQLRFPFQSMHPEFDPRVGNHGLVHLRLAVPGHGVFEHALDGIRIQPFAPLRDQLERSAGQRFLPVEQTGR